MSELAAWREALPLLPAQTKQAATIRARVSELESQQPSRPENDTSKKGIPTWVSGAGALGLLLWKAKFVLVFLATKAKLLMTGFTSWPALLSMIFALGVYWSVWGWAFALGFVVSIYLHEIGHVIALRRYSIPASAPMFIPGVGAFVRLDRHPETVVQDARVGLAGPWMGLFAALAAYGLYVLTENALFAAVAQTGAWINLFNMVPVWQLDGGRAFRSLTQKQRWLATGAVGATWFMTSETLLLFVGIAAAFRSATGKSPNEPDRFGLFAYAFLIAGLGAMTLVDVSMP